MINNVHAKHRTLTKIEDEAARKSIPQQVYAKSKKFKWLWIPVAAVVFIVMLITSSIWRDNADLEYAVAAMKLNFSEATDTDEEIFKIQINCVYEQSHLTKRYDAVLPLVTAIKSFGMDGQEAIDVANKLIKLHEYTGADYKDMIQAIRETAHESGFSDGLVIDATISAIE
jgi:hypothetical protein